MFFFHGMAVWIPCKISNVASRAIVEHSVQRENGLIDRR